jgi:3-deoxy-D-arabino-heptulosonate 7-phosphate (DAHP) synthase
VIKGWMCKLEEIVSSTIVDEILFSKPVLFFESSRQRFGVDNLMVVAIKPIVVFPVMAI